MNRRSVTYDGKRIRAPLESERRAVSDSMPLTQQHSGSATTPSSDVPDGVSDSFDFFSSSPRGSVTSLREDAKGKAAAGTAANTETAEGPDSAVSAVTSAATTSSTSLGSKAPENTDRRPHRLQPPLPTDSGLASIAPHLPLDLRLSRPAAKAYPYPLIQSSTHLSDYTLPVFPGERRYSSDPVRSSEFENERKGVVEDRRELLPPLLHNSTLFSFDADNSELLISPAREERPQLSFYTRPDSAKKLLSLPQKSVSSENSNAIGLLIGTYESASLLALLVPESRAPLSAPALHNPSEKEKRPLSPDSQPVHTRHDSQSSNFSQVSSASTLTNNNQQRFVKYVMNTQKFSNNSLWPMPNVLSWLKHHGFNVSWQDTFKRNEISGNRFLELANYDSNSSVWRQLSMRLDESDDTSTIDRFIVLLRQMEPETVPESTSLYPDEDLSEHRKSTASLWVNSNFQIPSKQRPYSYIDPGSLKSKEHLHKFFNRMHARTSSFESPKEIQPQLTKSPPGEALTATRSRKSGIFSTLRKYGGEKAAEIKKQVQSPSLTKLNSQRRRRDVEYRRPDSGNSDRSSKSNSQVYLPIQTEISPNSTKSFSALRLDETSESSDLSRREKLRLEDTTPDSRETGPRSAPHRDSKSESRGSIPSTLSLADIIPAENLPIPMEKDLKQILVSRDNLAFTSVILPEQLSALHIREAISRDLQLLDIGNTTFHLTDFHSKPGAVLSDDMLLAAVKHDVMVKLYVHQSVDLTHETGTFSSTSSDSKSFDTSGDNGKMYPATPQYLLQDPRDKSTDYLNFKEKNKPLKKPSKTELQEMKEKIPMKLTLPQRRGNSTVASAVSNMRTPPIYHENHSGVSPNAHFGANQTSNVGGSVGNLCTPNPGTLNAANLGTLSANTAALNHSLNSFNDCPQTFTVLRRAGREIDFDKRRNTPSESKAPRLIPNIYSSSVTNSSISPISASTIHPFKEEIGISPSSSRLAFRTASNGLESSFVAKRKPPPPPMASSSLRKKNPSSLLINRSEKKMFDTAKKFDFSSAPGIEPSDTDDEFFAKPIKNDEFYTKSTKDDEFFMKPLKDDEFFMKPVKIKPMDVRPPVEEVYDNLEKYFPQTILDKPIIDTAPEVPKAASKPASRKVSISRTFSNANMSPVTQSKDDEDEILFGEGPKLRKKMKTIRIVANEAKIKRLASMKAVSEAKKDKSLKRHVYNAINPSLNRANTKLWGQKVVEVTSDDIEKGYVSRIRNVSSNSYEEFAWIKGELIGRGSFGSVFLALNVSTGEMLAVKQVELFESSNEGIDALHKEVETMKDLDHLNIVQYLGLEQSKHTYSLFLEYVAGGSVASCLKSYGKFDEPLVKFITRQVLEGLKYIHENGILHRDLKADNLLLEVDGTCKISDFGISKKSQDIYSNNAEMSMQGTVFWMAPEVIHSMVEDKKQGYSAKVDIWSLGCVMVEMFAGKRPWSNEAVISAIYKLGKTKLAPPVPEEVSADAKDFLNQCFTIDSEKRPTAEQLLGHRFVQDDGFDFSSTKLSDMIKYNSRKSIK